MTESQIRELRVGVQAVTEALDNVNAARSDLHLSCLLRQCHSSPQGSKPKQIRFSKSKQQALLAQSLTIGLEHLHCKQRDYGKCMARSPHTYTRSDFELLQMTTCALTQLASQQVVKGVGQSIILHARNKRARPQALLSALRVCEFKLKRSRNLLSPERRPWLTLRARYILKLFLEHCHKFCV